MPRGKKATLFVDTSGVKGLSGVQTDAPVITRAPQKKKQKNKLPKKTAKGVKQLINKEKPVKEKRFQTNKGLTIYTGGPTSPAGSFFMIELSNLPQGDKQNMREGNDVYACGFKSNMIFTNLYNMPRKIQVLLVRDSNRRGLILDTTDWTDFYRGTEAATRPADGLIGDCITMYNKELYRIIKQWSFIIQETGVEGSVVQQRIDIPLREHLTFTYADAGSTVPREGRLMLIIHSAEVTSTAPTSGEVVTVEHFSRLFFKQE